MVIIRSAVFVTTLAFGCEPCLVIPPWGFLSLPLALVLLPLRTGVADVLLATAYFAGCSALPFAPYMHFAAVEAFDVLSSLAEVVLPRLFAVEVYTGAS